MIENLSLILIDSKSNFNFLEKKKTVSSSGQSRRFLPTVISGKITYQEKNVAAPLLFGSTLLAPHQLACHCACGLDQTKKAKAAHFNCKVTLHSMCYTVFLF